MMIHESCYEQVRNLSWFIVQEARDKLLNNARKILQNVQGSIEEHVSIPKLLEPISKRSSLLVEKEIYHLKRSDFSPKQKSLLLVSYIANRKKTPVERLYLCLLDSYKEPGMEGHYVVAQQLKSFGNILIKLNRCKTSVHLLSCIFLCCSLERDLGESCS